MFPADLPHPFRSLVAASVFGGTRHAHRAKALHTHGFWFILIENNSHLD